MLVLAGLYVTLPWWMSQEWLRRRIEQQLGRQTGRPVSIDQLAVSWARGVEVRGLRIRASRGDSLPLLEAPSLRVDLSPIDLLRDRLDRVQVDQPVINIYLDAPGREDLRALRWGARHGQVGRLSIRQAQVRLFESPQQAAPQWFLAVPSLELVGRHDQPLHRLAMSGRVGQDGWISLQAQTNPGSSPTAASAVLSLAGLELADLPPKLAAVLPVRQVSGRCGGRILLQLDRRGLVDQFSADVSIQRLQVRSQDRTLPVIEQAVIQARGKYDPLTGQMDLEHLQLRVPGLSLQGQVLAQGRLGPAQWGLVRHMNLAGEAEPMVLASLLGRSDLMEGHRLAGPVRFECHAHLDQPVMELSVDLDATQAAWLTGQESAAGPAPAVIKPPGTRLSLHLSGEIDTRTGQLQARDLEGRLGGNMVRCRGQLPLRGFFEAAPPDWPSRLAAMTDLKLTGVVQLADLGALSGLLPAMSAVQMDGQIGGQWLLEHGDDLRFRLAMEAPPGTLLRVGPHVRSPSQSRLSGELSVSLGPRGLRDVAAMVAIDQGQLCVQLNELALEGGQIEGRFDASGVQDLRKALVVPAPDDWMACGNLHGTFGLHHRPREVSTAQVQVDLEDLDLKLAHWLRKPAGLEAQLQVAGQWSAPPKGWRLLPRLRLPGLELQVQAESPCAGGPIRATLDGQVLDAHELIRHSPALMAWLGPRDAEGAASLHAEAGLDGQEYRYDVQLEATELGLYEQQTRQPIKSRGVPAQLSAGGSIRDEGSRFLLRHSGTLRLGASHLTARDVQATLHHSLLWRLESVSGHIDWRAALDQAAAELWPGLARGAQRRGISGEVSGGLQFSLDGHKLSVIGTADAEAMEVADLPGIPAPMPTSSAFGHGTSLIIHKSKGYPAAGRFELTYDVASGRLLLNDLSLDVEPLSMRMDASCMLHPWGLQGGPRDRQGHLAVEARNVSALGRLLSGLPVEPVSGGLFAEAQWTDEQGGRMPYVNVCLSDLTGRYRGRKVAASGQVRLSGLAATPDGLAVDRICVDQLQVKVGDNLAYLTADVRQPTLAPQGSVRLVGRFIDDRDLLEWLGGTLTDTMKPLAPEQADKVLQRARGAVEWLKPLAWGADLDVHVFVDHLRTYDPQVRQTYDVQAFRAQGSVKEGCLGLEYSGGVNGGLVSAQCDLDLTKPEPVLEASRTMETLVATENLQPQLALFFPGNRVEGLFDRAEQTQARLDEAVAGMIDSRYPLRRTGQAKSVAQRGLLKGQAMPQWVSRLFPGLNLTTYRYNRMTSFTEFLADGSARSDMVFSGPIYDIYIEGATDADHMGNYEIGLILLGAPQSAEWNHAYRQGRIPLLNFRARIEGGQMHDEHVSFLWPNQTLFKVFLKNNIFYRLWLNRSRG